jgi:predicted glutamine amidotransferase
MCRLFAFSFTSNVTKEAKSEFVDVFKSLAFCGAVLPRSTPGHQDGWGMAVYSSDNSKIVNHKSVSSAHLDNSYAGDLFFKDKLPQSGLVHLRKKTVGETLLENSHPFIQDMYSFIHNGTISQREVYPSLAPLCQGVTDSERVFRRFLEIKDIKQLSTVDAFVETLHEVRNLYPEHSALNSILHDGEQILVFRSINMNNKNFSGEELLNYYTLYLGKANDGSVIISSEKLPHKELTHTLLPNHSLSIIHTPTNTYTTRLLV